MAEVREKRDLVLPPGTYAFMQDTTNGVIKTYTGPTVINPTAQEVPIVYSSKSGTFDKVNLEDAVRKSVVTVEGFYVVLLNPAKGNIHPEPGRPQPSAELDVGRKINIPGPDTFALWPGQAADVIRGHHLRSNQYLLVRVYNEDEAKKNWTKAVVKPATEIPTGDAPATEPKVATAPPPVDLTIGKLLIIRGTEVSFYIPPTGVTVVQSGVHGDRPLFAREAMTLERLEYCILIDENGKKRFEIGPQVVFPQPTETFMHITSGGKEERKFRATELNPLQGLHIKVIADYKDEDGEHKAGDELFITGLKTAIYYPREEHSAIKYDGRVKHFAVAIPAGEGRYVMNRMTGEVDTTKGPAMLLPDPRHQVIVRRALTEREARIWYPGNQEAIDYNKGLRDILVSVPTTRAGAISEGDYERNIKGGGPKPKGGGQSVGAIAAGPGTMTVSYAANISAMETSRVSGDQVLVGEEFSRGSTYTQPRTITLDTKYQGCPAISPWTGYAVMVTSKLGKRRVERGPTTILLDYDETLEILKLSTGKPKTTDHLLETPYLRIENNTVSDIIDVETSDRVTVRIRLGYQVNFEGDSLKWFAVENYVKFLCDHVRSILRGKVRRIRVEDFYNNSTDILRDIILGKSVEGQGRPGMVFKENGMRVFDVEVLKVELPDERIRTLLDTAQHDVVKTNVEISNLKRNLESAKQKESIKIEEAEVVNLTAKRKNELAIELAGSELALIMAKIGNQLLQLEKQKEEAAQKVELENIGHQAKLDRIRLEKEQELGFHKRAQDISIEALVAEANAVVQRFSAAQGGFSEALLSLSNNETMVKVAQAWETQKVIGGESIADLLGRLFHNTPLKPLLNRLVSSNGQAAAAAAAATTPSKPLA